jgi:multiple sugar transport system substrate-binding protein
VYTVALIEKGGSMIRTLKIRKPVAVVASALALSSVLAACGSSHSSGTASSGSASAGGKTVTLTYALWDPHEEVGYKKSIAVFEKKHPNIKVNVEQIPYANYEAKLTQEFSAGGGPDLFWVNTPFLAGWIKDGVMKNIAPLIKKDHIDMSKYYPSLVKLHSHDGAIYGLPKDWDTIAFFYNKDYFKKHNLTPPTNWSWNPTDGGSFVHFLKEATIDSNGVNALSPKFNPNNVKVYGADVANSMQIGWGNLLAGDGGRVIAHPYAKKVAFDNATGVQTFNFIRDLMYKWHVAVPGSELGSNAANNSYEDVQLFAQGKAAMIMEGDWETTPISQAVKFPVGVVPLPSGPDGRWSVFNGLIDAINTHTKHPNAAWELEKWLGSSASERILGSGGYVWPAIKSLDPLFIKHWKAKGINMTPFLDEAQGNTITWPVAPGMNRALTVMTRDLGPIFLNSGSTASSVRRAATDADNDLGQAAS